MSVTDGSSDATLPSVGPTHTVASSALTSPATDTMQIIGERLDGLEQRWGIRVLYAVEAGSRAGGFPSPDSDYDVRFVYARPLPGYLRLDKVRDTITDESSSIFDITGWDLIKALRLAHVSNPTLIEWLVAPTVYRTSPEWEQLRPLLLRCYQPWPMRHHYLGMAIKNWTTRPISGPAVPKRYLFVIRLLLACRWIARHEAPPPVPLAELAQATLEPDMQASLAELVAMKARTPRALSSEPIPEWDAWIVHEFGVQQARVRPDTIAAGPSWDELSAAFRHALGVSD